jgi:Ca2+-binding RTX toxin-like protein
MREFIEKPSIDRYAGANTSEEYMIMNIFSYTVWRRYGLLFAAVIGLLFSHATLSAPQSSYQPEQLDAMTWKVDSIAELRVAVDIVPEGATILVEPGDYTVFGIALRWNDDEAAALRDFFGLPHDERSWNTSGIDITKSLTIRGDGGRANLTIVNAGDEDGSDPLNGGSAKGILTIGAAVPAVTVENLGLFGNKGQWNANHAGIRHEGVDLTVRNCEFGANNDGILASPAAGIPGDVIIEGSEFWGYGNSGLVHGAYIHAKKVIIRDSHFHDSVLGHHIKVIADDTLIENNLLEDTLYDWNGETPSVAASRAIDIEGGGHLTVRHNVIRKSTASDNDDHIFYTSDRAGNIGHPRILIEANEFDSGGRKNPIAIVNRSDVIVELRDNRFFNPDSDDLAYVYGSYPDYRWGAPLVGVGRSVQSGNTLNGQPMPERGLYEDMLPGTDEPDLVLLTSGDSLAAGMGDDVVFTGPNANQVSGGQGADLLVAYALPDVNDGRQNDALFGDDGDDLLIAANNQGNFLAGDAGQDILMDRDGLECSVMFGGDGDDLLYFGACDGRPIGIGGAGDDIIITLGAANKPARFAGGPGNDIFVGWDGPEEYSGGDGVDTIVFRHNFADYEITTKWTYRDIIRSARTESSFLCEFHASCNRNSDQTIAKDIEQLQFADGLYEMGTQQFYPGEKVIDLATVLANLPQPSLVPPEGVTVVGDTNQNPDPGNEDGVNDGEPDPEHQAPDDLSVGEDGILTGSASDDDFLLEWLTEDIIEVNGGTGLDRLLPHKDWVSVAVDLSELVLIDIERIEGGRNDDDITGSAGDDYIAGMGSQRYGDVLRGGAGDDTFELSDDIPDRGSTWVEGGAGTNRIVGTDGDDFILLADFSPENNIASIDGGAGFDILRANKPWMVGIIDLSQTTLINVERIEGSGGYPDHIIGSPGDDVIVGFGGSGGRGDIIDGQGGYDVVVYAGVEGDYVIETRSEDGAVLVTPADASLATDTLINVEEIRFDPNLVLGER